ncbi:DUF1161 domain-containing protein [Schlegelella sp. S2-27]|uniref:DUF1161 domain-containing protein n=1 Tax=Caldimonas mangrovi TaxID=2944811 RepID=A0ABT0YYA6_9BURK|nr:DUF1161 domain-containing protein [Caldimonas mangrovi]MCM5682818.1 DUF1161 domain-containing protein [Caldimonas mangrovi]
MKRAPPPALSARLLGGLCLAAAAALPATAAAERLECTVLLEQIEDKLQAHGVRHYRLDLVPADETADGKIVGSCNGGTRKIIYTRTPAPAQKAQAAT